METAGTVKGRAMARARYIRMSPTKARRVVDVIRGMPAGDAEAALRFAPQAASEPVLKVLMSAVANATNNHDLERGGLFVAEAYVDEGPTYKRIRPRAQGRAYRVRKRSCHITLVVEDRGQESAVAAEVRRGLLRKSAAKKAAAKTTTAKTAAKTTATKTATKGASTRKASTKKSADTADEGGTQ